MKNRNNKKNKNKSIVPIRHIQSQKYRNQGNASCCQLLILQELDIVSQFLTLTMHF